MNIKQPSPYSIMNPAPKTLEDRVAALESALAKSKEETFNARYPVTCMITKPIIADIEARGSKLFITTEGKVSEYAKIQLRIPEPVESRAQTNPPIDPSFTASVIENTKPRIWGANQLRGSKFLIDDLCPSNEVHITNFGSFVNNKTLREINSGKGEFKVYDYRQSKPAQTPDQLLNDKRSHIIDCYGDDEIEDELDALIKIARQSKPAPTNAEPTQSPYPWESIEVSPGKEARIIGPNQRAIADQIRFIGRNIQEFDLQNNIYAELVKLVELAKNGGNK